MFTGQTKELFEKWFKNSPQCIKLAYVILADLTHNELVARFYELPFSMQQGVLLQFLREQGISVTIRFGLSAGYYCEISEDDESDDIVLTDFESYDTALKSAITKAGELLNERSKK